MGTLAFFPGAEVPQINGLTVSINAIVLNAERRLNSWCVPPNWSRADWIQEVHQIAVATAWLASTTTRPATLEAHEIAIQRRIVAAVLSAYRREWAYAKHIVTVESSKNDEHEFDLYRKSHFRHHTLYEATAAITELLQELEELSPDDSWLLTQIYFVGRTETDLAKELCVSQCIVNRRKQTALDRLRHAIETSVSSHS